MLTTTDIKHPALENVGHYAKEHYTKCCGLSVTHDDKYNALIIKPLHSQGTMRGVADFWMDCVYPYVVRCYKQAKENLKI